MSPSRSSLDRLPKALSEKWEARRAHWESQLREQEAPPAEAAVLAVSLDGVMAPMKDGARQDKREHSRQQGKPTRGPAGSGARISAAASAAPKDVSACLPCGTDELSRHGLRLVVCVDIGDLPGGWVRHARPPRSP